MNDNEFFLFDLQGYLVVEDAASAARRVHERGPGSDYAKGFLFIVVEFDLPDGAADPATI